MRNLKKIYSTDIMWANFESHIKLNAFLGIQNTNFIRTKLLADSYLEKEGNLLNK